MVRQRQSPLRNRFERFATRWAGRYAARAVREHPAFSEKLLKAHLNVRPDSYLAMWVVSVLLSAVIGLAAAVALTVVFILGPWSERLNIARTAAALMAGVGVGPAIIVHLYYSLRPDRRAERIAQDIDANLPYAVNFLSALTATGVTIVRSFESLAQQRIYGALGAEAAIILRDIEVMGMDTVSALKLAIIRSPSTKFQDLLGGITTTILSGGDLRTYFKTKTDQYATENVIELRGHLENVGLFAESFITIGAAAPLFLFTMALVMALVDTTAGSFTLILLNLIIFLIMPITAIVFILIFKSLRRQQFTR